MKRTVLVLFLAIIGSSIVSCGHERPRIDIATQRMLQAKDTIPLAVTFLAPSGKTEKQEESFKILVGFNQPMVPLQRINDKSKDDPLQIEPRLRGTYRWLGTRTLAFIPDDTLQTATRFTVRLSRNRMESLTGMALSRDTSWTFETSRPRLLSSMPYHGAQFVESDAHIYLNFNAPMSPRRAREKIRVYYTKGMPSDVWCARVKSAAPRFRGEIPYGIRNLRDDEKTEYPLTEWDNTNTLVLVPRAKLPVESQIEVALHAGLLAKHGNLGTDDENVIKYNTYNRFALLDHSPTAAGEGALRLCFANRVSVMDVMKNIAIVPGIEIPLEYAEDEWSTNEMYLYLPFVPGNEYDIQIKKTLKDIYGNGLDRDYRFTFKKGDFTPHVEMPTGINIVEAKSDLRFPITVVNADSVYLQMAKLGIDDVVPFLNTRDLFWSSGTKFVPPYPNFFGINRYWHTVSRQRYHNREIRLPLSLSEILGSRRSGFVFIQLDNLGQTRFQSDFRYQRAFIEISDIGVTWKYSPENNLVWVTSLDNASPIRGARIQLRNKDNRVVWEGNTGSNGFCESPGWAELGFASPVSSSVEEAYEWSIYEEPKMWLTISAGEDVAVYSNQWHFGIDPWRFNIPYTWYVQPEEYETQIFTEKGLYRSGETVHVKGILRKKRRGVWVRPDVDRVFVTVRNSRDEEIMMDTLRINEYGSYFSNIAVDNEAPTGVYSINVTLPGKPYTFYQTFRVEAYRPAEFEVVVTAVQDTFLAGESFQGTVKGKYLFGMPMKDAPVQWNLRRTYYELDFPEHKGYQFGEYLEESERELLGSGTGRLNGEGEYKVSTRLSKRNISTPSLLYLEGSVTAPNMTAVAGEQNWLVLNAEYLIGLKTAKYLFTMGDTVAMSVITVNPHGEKIAGNNVSIEVFRREWKSIKKARFGGRYEWISEQIDTRISKHRVKSSKDSTLVKISPGSPGYYFARASCKDRRGRLSFTRKYFYVAGRGIAGWEMRDDDIIELVADRDDYRPGDTARILVKSPYDSARCLVTVEREFVIDRFTKVLRGNADYIELPIKSGYMPNIYVCVSVLRGRVRDLSWDEEKQQDLGKPQFKIGYVNLKVGAAEKRLNVAVRPDRADYGPRDTVDLQLEVTDYRGKSVATSEMAVFAVDLGVLNLIDYRTPDPFEYFYRSRSLSVRTVESRVNILGERSYGEKGEERGGSGAFAGEGVSYREKFIATAFYKGDVRTDQEGRARVRFALPDNLTKFRIMAVAQTPTSEFGSSEATVTVSLPFMLTPSIPRFVRVGDEFKAGVVLHNRSAKKQNANVECVASGLKQIDVAAKHITLMPGASVEVLYRFDAESAGNATFEFKARMGEERDALKLKIPVIDPPLYEAVATSSSTEDSSVEAIVVPSQVYEGLGGLQITLAPTFMAGMNKGVEFLWGYPYYCLEQRLSKILPLIVGGEVIDRFRLAPVSSKVLRDTVQAILNAVSEYQSPDGGFVYFKGSRHACPYLSAYTMYVLYRAQKDGYEINKKMVGAGIEFLRWTIRSDDIDPSYPYDKNAQLKVKAFCLYSLALWGRYEHPFASRLFERRDQLSVFGKVLLLKAGRILNMGQAFENELSGSLLNKIKISPTSAHFEEHPADAWTLSSPAKVSAAILQAFIELDLPFVYREQVMNWLVSERGKKTRPTTHENAFVFDAFLTYYRRYEAENPDFTARVLIDGKDMIQQSFKGGTKEKPKEFNIPFERLAKDTVLPVVVKKEGTGRLYYTLRMNYALREKPYPYDGGFYVWKEFCTLDGRRVSRFNRGDVYQVIVHIVTPETRLFAVVDDPLPAGFAPVQTFFATEARALSETYDDPYHEGRSPWWGGFDHTEYYDDRVLFFAQQLFPGEYTEKYFVRAVSEGKFLSPQTHAMEMYAPEVFGTSIQEYSIIK